MGRLRRVAVVTFSACFAWAAVASAQTNAAKQGPLVFQPVSEGPVIAPEVKWANFNGAKGGVMVGGYGGWMLDSGLLLGGGADFLVNHNFGDPVAGMGYGGFVGGWSMPGDHAIRPGVRALVGFGQASLTSSSSFPVPLFPDHHGRNDNNRLPSPIFRRLRFHENFFVFEPQASIAVRLMRNLGIDVSGGYRAISNANGFDSMLRGASVSVGVRLGPHI